MIFYEIKLLTPPKFVFACQVDLENYNNKFPNIENLLEFAVCEQGDILYEYKNGEKEIVCPGMFIPITKDLHCHTSMASPGRQKHTTVGIVADYQLKKHDTETFDREALRKRMESANIMLIPYHWQLGDSYETVYQLLKKIIPNAVSQQSQKQLFALSDWYRLSAYLTEFVIKKLDNTKILQPPSALRYAEQVQEYIHVHYQEPLSVSEIAKYIGISAGYLHTVFKSVTGYGVLEYINQYRVWLAMQYIKSRNLSLKKVAALVGIEDVAYMSRLFKKTTGVSYREFVEQKSPAE